ncbi:MAG: tRNA (uridine(34)/cytosine(34)/5-carboxymethylaminomethyluridine(34)-2'-O)-methyltransferase TrmL [Clostridia bacterium]|nr:tRNA (uridine(34)/cytosine(34)/5-carboxymethylaminomethyluridine(34)-2'-O)-methyltransferase TrmL [Clostridia bacterium]
MEINIVLVEPEIPQNTGNIARTCAAIGAKLHLVHPLGFSISEKQVKRSGLDYWDKLDIEEHISFDRFLDKYQPEKNNMFFVTTKGKQVYSNVNYNEFDKVFLLFGKETKGLPEEILKKYINNTIRIPMKKDLRSLNLSNSVAILAYEALRQMKFDGMEEISDYFDKRNL